MKKPLLSLLLIALFSGVTKAQKQTEERDPAPRKLSPQAFKSFYSRRITHVITGERSLSSIGSFVAVNITKPTASVGFTKALFVGEKDDKDIRGAISVAATGGFNENSISVFSNKKLNKSAELRLNYSYIPLRWRHKWHFTKSPSIDISVERTKAINNYFNFKINEQNYKEEKLTKEINLIRSKYPGKLSDSDILSDAVGVSLEDRVAFNAATYELELINTDKALPVNERALYKAREDSLNKVIETLNISSMRFVWFDLLATVKYQRYYTHESAAAFDKQLVKDNLVHYRIGGAINHFFDSKILRYKLFLRGEYTYGRTNNTEQLQTSSINTVQQTNSTLVPSNFRQVEDEVSAYNFSEYRSFHSNNIKLDAVKPFTSKGGAAFHLYYNVVSPTEDDYKDANDNVQPLHTVQDVGLGIILSLNEKDKAKAFLNIEPYFTLKDIEDKYNQKVDGKSLSLFQRNEIGIRVAVPFGNLLSPL